MSVLSSQQTVAADAPQDAIAPDQTGPTEEKKEPVLATHEKDMIAVLDELEAIEAMDPAAKEQLVADLREAKQENWPLIVQQFKSALAYRQQLTAKQQAAPPVEPSPAVSTPKREPQTVAPAPAVVEQINYVTDAMQPSDWRDHLELAIAELQQEINRPPSSTEEVHQHLRLRMLHLLAGHEEDALLPISGASPAMQDYWARQLLAISTFLDRRRQPDDKQRADGSLVHFDRARAKLAELATLQVRNLIFVESVDGYGVYQPRAKVQFRPGEQVSLYGEVENFQSTSTKDGYRTKFGASYEVSDLNGQRVDGRAFPDVEDLCQNIRRDFHMQYGINLPTRIYPGKYELKVIITDQLSHKIGQASVPFEIVE
ncbi:MAG: hypothetical protein MI725_03945 [Pirellulales bacterium]|nr:hypothetical protein [Pirellulales bacterium]